MIPTDPRVEVLNELRTISTVLRQILAALGQSSKAAPDVAPDALLSGTHGDPIVRAKDPNDWTGDSMKGRQFSECPPAYLDMLADRFDYFAGRETDEKKAGYNRLDARRARGWAARIRGGWTAPQQSRVADETQTEPQW